MEQPSVVSAKKRERYALVLKILTSTSAPESRGAISLQRDLPLDSPLVDSFMM
jgi:hypothetical protein